VLSHDPLPPVIRREWPFTMRSSTMMSASPDCAQRADTSFEIRKPRPGPGVIVTELGLLDLIVLRSLDILVDARMQKYLATPDLPARRLTIGLGPGFAAAPLRRRHRNAAGQGGQIIQHGRPSRPMVFRALEAIGRTFRPLGILRP
jgi:hypothetical protein